MNNQSMNTKDSTTWLKEESQKLLQQQLAEIKKIPTYGCSAPSPSPGPVSVVGDMSSGDVALGLHTHNGVPNGNIPVPLTVPVSIPVALDRSVRSRMNDAAGDESHMEGAVPRHTGTLAERTNSGTLPNENAGLEQLRGVLPGSHNNSLMGNSTVHNLSSEECLHGLLGGENMENGISVEYSSVVPALANNNGYVSMSNVNGAVVPPVSVTVNGTNGVNVGTDAPERRRKSKARSEQRNAQQQKEREIGLREFQYHRIEALKKTNGKLIAIQRTVLGIDFTFPIGRVVLHTRFAMTRRRIESNDVRKLSADPNEMFVMLGTVHKKKEPFVMKLDVNETENGRSGYQICTVKNGTACLCYRRIMTHSVSPFIIDPVYRPGRTYYVYGIGKFNCGSNKHGNNPCYEDCLLVLFDGHFIWVQKDLICACSFCWQESPDGPEAKKLEEVFENVKREKFDFFQSFESLDATFHPYPPPMIPYEKEIKKSKFLLGMLAYDASQKMLMLNRVGTYNCRKTPIIYSDKQRSKYVLTCNPTPLYPDPLPLPESVNSGVDMQLKIFTAKVLETSLQNDLETNTVEEPKADPTPRAPRPSTRRASTGGRKRRRLLDDGDYEAPQSAQHTAPGGPRANRKSVSQGNGTPGLAALLRATEEADAREIERPPIEEEDDDSTGTLSPTAPAIQDVEPVAQIVTASLVQAPQVTKAQSNQSPEQGNVRDMGEAGTSSAVAFPADGVPSQMKSEVKIEDQATATQAQQQVEPPSRPQEQIQMQVAPEGEAELRQKQLDGLYSLGGTESQPGIESMMAVRADASASLPTNLQIPQMLQAQRREH